MQVFGQQSQGGDNISGKAVAVGASTVRVVRASSLALGVHPVRFYPLSPEYYQGADYPLIVQSFHWLNKQPILCRQNSYDYTVPDTQEKPLIGTDCPICRDKFAWYRKAKELGFKNGEQNNPPEATTCHNTGRELMERYSAVSLVSFIENESLAFPVLFTYGRELMDRIQTCSYRCFSSTGVNICDPQKGYMFDIIVGTKVNTSRRDYRDSMNSMNNAAVDITDASWKWAELSQAIKSEIVPIPTVDEVRDFYIKNYNAENSSQQFVHPAFNKELSSGQNAPVQIVPLGQPAPVQTVAPSSYVNNSNPIINTPAVEVSSPVPPAPPESINTQVAPAVTSNNENVPAFVPPVKETTILFPCHASVPNGSGYDEQDKGCQGCEQSQGCFKAKNGAEQKKVGTPVNNQIVPSSEPFKQGGGATGHRLFNGGEPANSNKVADNVLERLSSLQEIMQK